jgi:hypothetical protein
MTFGINITNEKNKGSTVDSILQLSIFAQTLGKTFQASIPVQNMLTCTFSQAHLGKMAFRAVL